MDKRASDDVIGFIRQHRSNESNFELLDQKLKEITASNGSVQLLTVAEEKAVEYRKAKETGGSAWPEFEKFVTEFERAILNE